MISVSFHISFLPSNLSRKDAIIALFVPLLNPVVGTQGLINPEEVHAWLVIFSLDLLTAVEIDVILPAITSLVLVGEPGIERGRLQHIPLFCHFSVFCVWPTFLLKNTYMYVQIKG